MFFVESANPYLRFLYSSCSFETKFIVMEYIVIRCK